MGYLNSLAIKKSIFEADFVDICIGVVEDGIDCFLPSLGKIGRSSEGKKTRNNEMGYPSSLAVKKGSFETDFVDIHIGMVGDAIDCFLPSIVRERLEEVVRERKQEVMRRRKERGTGRTNEQDMLIDFCSSFLAADKQFYQQEMWVEACCCFFVTEQVALYYWGFIDHEAIVALFTYFQNIVDIHVSNQRVVKLLDLLVNTLSKQVAFKSRKDLKKKLELEEARKAGLALLRANSQTDGPSLKHQRKQKLEPNTKSSYDRGGKVHQADKYRKGACEKEEARRKYLEEQVIKKLEGKINNQGDSDGDDDYWIHESKQMDFAKIEKRVRTTGGGSTGTISLQYIFDVFSLRNFWFREDRAKYLENLDLDSAYYDPKTRSMRENPLPNADPNEKFYGGDNQYRNSGQALEFKMLNNHSYKAFTKGIEIHLQAAPSQAEFMYNDRQVKKRN
ncbi:hypothetical protein FEM48_Zijuj11G0011200 [Ziziphus jujuba var. spinosa]|uniref:Pre-mRNA-splicing factor SLU7 n=1 Tax=Ziziphus jujuba var. spinosa TaxID=714518 RepID=A0A978UFZ0_ZIZJJ|nr:hypothetical protein FEM48_Zijuj11G0011200 [Ziziphus jujuba var. spinosa]